MKGKSCPGPKRETTDCNQNNPCRDSQQYKTLDTADSGPIGDNPFAGLVNLFSMISEKMLGDPEMFQNLDFRSSEENEVDRTTDRCKATDIPDLPDTCTHDQMMRNILEEIETLKNAFMSANKDSYSIEKEFKKLMSAHNQYGFEKLPCKLEESVYYRSDNRVGKDCNLRTSQVNDAAKQLIIFEENFLSFHSCSYSSCQNTPMREFANIFNQISKVTMNINVLIPYPEGLHTSGGGNEMQQGSEQIPKGLMCNRDNKQNGIYQRLIGGVPTDRSYHPWFTQLKVTTGPTSAFACGGTIIDDQWIISSSKHCCVSANNKIEALIGGGNWVEGINSHRGEFGVKAEKIYMNVGGSDVCLLKVPSLLSSQPSSCYDCYAKACLPTSDQKAENGMYCWVVGNPGASFAELGVNIFGQKYCLDNSWIQPNQVDFRTEFCGGKPDLDGDGYTDAGEGICGSDRGGPLICNSPDGTPTLMGISSRRSDPSTCASSGYPDIFINVPAVTTYIQNIMNSNSGY